MSADSASVPDKPVSEVRRAREPRLHSQTATQATQSNAQVVDDETAMKLLAHVKDLEHQVDALTAELHETAETLAAREAGRCIDCVHSGGMHRRAGGDLGGRADCGRGAGEGEDRQPSCAPDCHGEGGPALPIELKPKLANLQKTTTLALKESIPRGGSAP